MIRRQRNDVAEVGECIALRYPSRVLFDEGGSQLASWWAMVVAVYGVVMRRKRNTLPLRNWYAIGHALDKTLLRIIGGYCYWQEALSSTGAIVVVAVMVHGARSSECVISKYAVWYDTIFRFFPPFLYVHYFLDCCWQTDKILVWLSPSSPSTYLHSAWVSTTSVLLPKCREESALKKYLWQSARDCTL